MFPNLNAEQARKGLNEEGLANVIGVTREALRYKKRDGKFTYNEIRKLCDLFSVTFDYLFFETEGDDEDHD